MISNVAPFTIPSNLVATEPAESRGLTRDQVQLMVMDRATGKVTDTRFPEIGRFLEAGDLLVFNASRTLPSALPGHISPSTTPVEVRLAEHLPDDSWFALLLCGEGERFSCGLRTGIQIQFRNDLSASVIGRHALIPRLWKIHFSQSGSRLIDSIYRIGQPIRYDYIHNPWSLDYYQSVYATEPGSAEMPSAGRAFTWRIILDLRRRGIETAQVLLHTGLSSYMDDELDRRKLVAQEQIRVSERAAAKINRALRRGDSVIAVGTTSLRAVESASPRKRLVEAFAGSSSLHIDRNYRPRVIDGLLTGFHEPEASHLDILRAFLSEDQIFKTYRRASELGYRWHEFGDLNLVL